MEDMTRQSRNLLERAKAIFEVINQESKPFAKSKLSGIGINPETAEKWLEMIIFIQAQPKIELIRTENTVIVRKI